MNSFGFISIQVQSRKMSYEYEAEMEDQYMQSLLKLFKKTLTDGFFHLLIVDCNNITLQYLPEFYSISLMHQYTVSTFITLRIPLKSQHLKIQHFNKNFSHMCAKCH